MLDYLSAIPEWLRGAIAAGIVTYFVLLRLQKRREKLNVILELVIKPRSLQHFGAWVVVSNLSSTPIWLQRLIFRAEEWGRFGKPVPLAVGRTIDTGKDEQIECHESIYEAFEQINPGNEFYVGYVDITANVRSNGESAKQQLARRLTSHRYGVRDVKETSRSERFRERLRTRYLFWRLGR